VSDCRNRLTGTVSRNAAQARLLLISFLDLPHLLRDALYRHRRRRQGEPVRCPPPQPMPRLISRLGYRPRFFHPPTTANRTWSGSLCFMHEILMLATRRGNMRELDQPRSAQTCVVFDYTLCSRSHSFKTLSLSFPLRLD